MDTKELSIFTREIDSFAGLEHIGNGKNKDIETYFQSFMTWINWNNVLNVVNNYKDTDINLQYVTAYDFLVWLLHYGDVYDNLLRHYINQNSPLNYKKAAHQLYQLRKFHPKFSFAVALTSHIKPNNILSDNDLDKIIPILAEIPNNKLSKITYTQSNLGDGLYKAIYSLSNFSIQRASRKCF